MADEILTEIRASVARTMAEPSAVIRYTHSQDVIAGQHWVEPNRAGLPRAWGGTLAWGGEVVWDATADQDPPAGVEIFGGVDFATQRSAHHEWGQGWSIFEPGREVQGERDEWEAVADPSRAVAADEPLWLLAMVGGVRAARSIAVADGPRAGWRHYAITATNGLAAAAFGRPLQSGHTHRDSYSARDAEAEDHAIAIWLDQAGRLRRVANAEQPVRPAVEFGDFGAPVTIAFPPEDIVWHGPEDDEKLP